MTSIRMSPNRREVLSAISTITGQQEYLTSTNGALNTTGGGSGGGGTQYSSGTPTPSPVIGNALIYDNSGTLQNVSVANPLPVSATFSGSITSSPTFATSPGSSPTPAYGLIDASFRQVVVGAGTAGSSTGGVLSVQGVASGTAVPVSGTFFQTTQPVSLATNTPTLQSGSTTAVTQTTAANLNATVVQGTAAALTGGWPVINGELADVTGTFTNATQTTSVTASSLDGYGNVLISINGTYGTATAVFEGSDDSGTTWYPISEADRTDSNVIEAGYTSLTNTNRAWQINIPGFDSIRVRSTAVASGTVNVRISPSAAPSSAGLSVSIGTALPTGSNVIGHIITDSGSTTAVTGTVTISGAVTNAGTFAVQNMAATPAGTNGIGNVGTVSAVVNVNQQTVNTTAVQLSASSTVPTNGILVGALSTNAASIFVGGSGVTTSTGVELLPGASIPFTANLNTLYIISVASTTDKIWYNVT